MRNREPHVFLCYSHEDPWEMRAIYNELRLAGFRVWSDGHLNPGTPNWQQAIRKALDNAACVVCLCSRNAAESQWVNIELDLALRSKLKIYPVLVRGTATEAIPIALALVQFTDCRREFVASIQKMIHELRAHHQAALMLEMNAIFERDGILWTHFGSVFWFASEVRKVRLFLVPECPTIARVRDSLAQLIHHAKRLNVDKFTIRDLQHVLRKLPKGTEELTRIPADDRQHLENKLRMAQDKVAGLAERADPSFKDGPRPGKPDR